MAIVSHGISLGATDTFPYFLLSIQTLAWKMVEYKYMVITLYFFHRIKRVSSQLKTKKTQWHSTIFLHLSLIPSQCGSEMEMPIPMPTLLNSLGPVALGQSLLL